MCGFCVCAGIRVYYHCAVRLRYAAWCLHAEKVVHLGADETGRGVSGDLCSKQGQQADANAAQIERKLLKLAVENGKQPTGWEEMLTETRAALNTCHHLCLVQDCCSRASPWQRVRSGTLTARS